jgi:protoporphyrinogen IX oxidase
MYPLIIKALHIVFVVTWFAGLFYIVRLFIYHTEAESKEEPEKSILQNQYKLMESRLWYFITWPSMIITLILGNILAWPYLSESQTYSWLIPKLVLVAGLVFYHLGCHSIFRQLQNNVIKYSSFQLRLWNEVATLFLFAIVFIIVMKDLLDWKWAVGALLVIAIIILLSVVRYKKKRETGKAE